MGMITQPMLVTVLMLIVSNLFMTFARASQKSGDFAVLYMDQPLKLDYLYAAMCLLGAVYFIFRT